VEWDPLHMHPSMEVDSSPHITPLYHGSRHQPHEEDQGHSVEQQQQFHPPRHAQPGFNMQIYEGFDFGFGKQQTSESTSGPRRMRAQKSEADLHQQNREAESKEPQWNGLHSPSRRHLPEGFDEADYFIRRGGWKRRGIVFGCTAEAQESEDDCFELP